MRVFGWKLGILVKVFVYDDFDRIIGSIENKIIYIEEDFWDFFIWWGWIGLCEVGGFWDIDFIEDLWIGGVYEGVVISNGVWVKGGFFFLFLE